MRSLLYLPVFSAYLAAQTAVATDPIQLLRDVRTAIQDDSLATAAELAGKLDVAVQERYSAWLIRDADERIQEALAWLPGDTESVWVNREPFTIRPELGHRYAVGSAQHLILSRSSRSTQWWRIL